MRLLPASTTNTSPFTPTAAATGLENVGIVAPLLVKEAWAWPAFAVLVVKSACPSTAMATGGGLAKVVSPEARAGQLLCRHTVGKRRRVNQEAVGARVRNEKVARGIESEACGHGQGVSIQYSRRPIGYRETRLADDEGGGRIRGARSERRGGILQHAAVTGIHHEQIAGAVHGQGGEEGQAARGATAGEAKRLREDSAALVCTSRRILVWLSKHDIRAGVIVGEGRRIAQHAVVPRVGDVQVAFRIDH